MKNQNIILTISSLVLLSVVIVNAFLPVFVLAEGVNPVIDRLDAIANEAGYEDADEDTAIAMIGTIVQVFLSMLGIIFIILMIYGGYNWMIAAGDESKVETAKKTIRNAIIGLLLVLSSYGIWQFIYFYLV